MTTWDEILLIPEKIVKGRTGATAKHPQMDDARTVNARVESVYMQEYYTALAAGKTITVRFILYRAEWNGEMLVRYKGQDYRVVRKYEPMKHIDLIELYCAAAEGQ